MATISGIKTIVYAGVDSRFADEILEYFQKLYPSLVIEFHKVFDPDSVGKMQDSILGVSPDLIYIDFSFKPQRMLNLANFVCRDEGLSKVSVLGLFDYDTDKDAMFSSFSLGVSINHIKSIEVQDVVHHGVVKAFPEVAKALEVLTVKSNAEINLKCAMPIGFISDQYIHVESNIRFAIGDELNIEVDKFSDMSLLNQYEVARTSNTNLYTRNNYWYDLNFNFFDSHPVEELKVKKKIAEKEMLDKVIPLLDKELKEALCTEETLANNRKKDLQQWIETHEKDGIAKTSRIVVVDQRVDLISEAITKFETKPYSIRYYTNIENTIQKVMRTMPGVIFYSLDYPEDVDKYLYDEQELENKILKDQLNQLEKAWEQSNQCENINAIDTLEKDQKKKSKINTLEVFAKLIELIREVPDYKPVIVINNCHEKKELLDKTLNYERYIIDPQELTLEKIETFGDKYQSSDGSLKTHNPEKRFHHKEKRVYIDKYDQKRFANLHFKANLLSISESEIYFASTLDILPNTCLRISNPVDMFITILPLPKKDFHFERPPLKKVYFGVIWGLGEKEKSSLRRYVNQLMT